MPIVLEVRGLRKRFAAGAGGCLASAEVLRGVDLVVRAGESVAIVGASGAGKSTLLLCLAGLLSADRGDVRWFGDRSRAVAVRRVVYHVTRADLLRAGRPDEPNVHLVDVGAEVEAEGRLEDWVYGRRERGDAVLVATRDADLARSFATRVLALSDGTLRDTMATWTRVAEAVH